MDALVGNRQRWANTRKGFGSIVEGGQGEGRRTGVFGRSGSGKSIVTPELLGGYAMDEDRGILLLDLEGEYADDSFGDANFEFSFHDFLDAPKSRPDNINAANIGDKSALYTILYGIMKRFRYRVYRNFRDDDLANALVVLDEAREVYVSKDEADAILAFLEKYEYASLRHALFTTLWKTGNRQQVSWFSWTTRASAWIRYGVAEC